MTFTIKSVTATRAMQYEPENYYLGMCKENGETPTNQGFLDFIESDIAEDFNGEQVDLTIHHQSGESQHVNWYKWVLTEIEAYLRDTPPWAETIDEADDEADETIDEALIPKFAAEITRRFDCTEIFNQIDELGRQLLREHQSTLNTLAPADAGKVRSVTVALANHATIE